MDSTGICEIHFAVRVDLGVGWQMARLGCYGRPCLLL